MKQKASLDASFWINACVSNIIHFVPEYFTLVVPSVVAAEIRYPLDVLGIEANTAILFNQWLNSRKIKLSDPEKPVDWFHRGENAAIALAIEQDCFLLIDDASPYHRAKSSGLNVVGTSELIIFLYDYGRISHEQAKNALQLTHASKKQKRTALTTLEILVRKKGT
ncbi:MAG TPA: hypothetical protein ENK32_03860 [Anaerolineae bacterium]|nr:hypothetical protein [Anaerolineae bacterium]